jgi:HPt (histidine-containing phosphotransfer) domain-containing protein
VGSLLNIDAKALKGIGESLEKELKKDGKIDVQKKLKELQGLFDSQ